MKKTPKYYTKEETTIQLENIASRRNLSPKDFLVQLGAVDVESASEICSKQNIVVNTSELEKLFPPTLELLHTTKNSDILDLIQSSIENNTENSVESTCVTTEPALDYSTQKQKRNTKEKNVKPSTNKIDGQIVSLDDNS